MKKIKKCIFMFVAVLFASFIFAGSGVKALDKVVLNADSNGEAQGVYEIKIYEKDEETGEDIPDSFTVAYKQYTRSRDITVTINIDAATLASYDTKFDVCEIIPENTAGNVREEERCAYYLTSSKTNNFQLAGRNDGEKVLKIRFYSNYTNKAVVDEVTKAIIIDSTGPKITLNGGEYLYLAAGKDYKEPGFVCEDTSDILDNSCKVTGYQDAKINKQKTGYQYIRYTVTDFLGNETNVLRKVMVEVSTDDGGIDMYWFFAIGVVVIVSGVLAIKVIKNKDQQKNQSVL